MKRPGRRAHAPNVETRLIAPAILGAGTILVCSAALPALAGPHILAEYLPRRFATGIWVWHSLLFMVMGYTSGYQTDGRLGTGGAKLACIAGAGAALFYTGLGLLGGGWVLIPIMMGAALAAGLIGALVAKALKDGGLMVAVAYIALGIGALALTFARTGVVSGKGTRTVTEVTMGMMTGQKDVPVPGIRVVLTTPDGKMRLYQTTTDHNGGYILNGPPPGEYMLFAHDTEPDRGTGVWVNTRVKAGAMFSGQGLGAGDFMVPGYRQESSSPFIDRPSGGSGSGLQPGGGGAGHMLDGVINKLP